ncbi:esterase-like activity of phytase family protein [Dethiosulfovibrio sp. F2B]|uniref:esterase-like activity of phytase family protein n=1 Tax=Dethiosulfovibrio faecalis TaxID=2720018 RepID=UPI001F47BC84|nr:esterase-like activity of phytase family protein [Dethiosulfovibrio faecalis]MCF4152038.1 esterase-like activity of phytase family protein [Dethiosulfovibrio faecalis]
MKLKSLGIAASLSVFTLLSPPSSEAEVRSFALENHYAVPGGQVAEIVTATPDGMSLFYTNASGEKVGILDISDPASPRGAGSIEVSGEPTSAAVSVDGRYLAVAVRNGDNLNTAAPGTLGIYDISLPDKPRHLGDVTIGVGPDSVACSEIEGKMVVVVAIEDEESDEEGEATLGGKRPGRVDVVIVNPSDVPSSNIASVELGRELLGSVEGINYPADPQPEFVAISSSGTEAAVSIQESNGVAVIDISDPAKPSVKKVFCSGTVERKADLKKDGRISFSDNFKGRREPDGLTYLSIGGKSYIALANEGDTGLETFGDGVYPGGRGISLHDTDGKVLWDSGVELDIAASLVGHYPDGRSSKKGAEIEGIASTRMFGDDLLIVASERGSFLAVYRVRDVFAPELIKILPTGSSPEGVIAITGRQDGKQLIVSANEGDGTVNLYSVSDKDVPGDPSDLTLSSRSEPWSALSGFSSDGKHIYAVPDNAWSSSRIWRISMSRTMDGVADIDGMIPITKDGTPAAYDLEGICWTKDGFWLVGEGKNASENLLIFVDHDGKVREEHPLPQELIDEYGDPGKFGFEGVAASSDGSFLYVAMQRGFDSDDKRAAILRFSPSDGKWEVSWYPLDDNPVDSKKYWMGLSDQCLVKNDKLLVLERDKGKGDSARVKRVYSVDLKGFSNGSVLDKKLVKDIVESHGLLLEKAESLCLFDGDIWMAIDNDGAGWTRMLNLGSVD